MKKLTLSLIILMSIIIYHQNALAQSTVNGHGLAVGEYIGGNLLAATPLDIGQSNALPINFYTTGGAYLFAAANLRMTIFDAAASPFAGFVGIGTAGPTQLLQVSGGNIDVLSLANSYMIGSQRVLWHNNDVTSIYGGVGAGAATTPSSTLFNTFVGNLAGNAVTTSVSCVFVGYKAGFSETSGGHDNTFVGKESGRDNTIGDHNAFFGDIAGLHNTDGGDNTFIGAHSGTWNLTGFNNAFLGFKAGEFSLVSNNTFIGFYSGQATTSGGNNTFLGFESGLVNTVGDRNIFIGADADASQNNLVNAGAIGFNAIVTGNDQMILGGTYLDLSSNQHTVDVGIGLSNIAPRGPGEFQPISPTSCMLEINAINFTGATHDIDDMWSNPSPNPWNCGTGASGLRFRDLTIRSTPCINHGGGILAVDDDGNVIYVEERTGFGKCSGSGPTVLPDNIGMNFFNKGVYFVDPASVTTQSNEVGIGHPCPTALQGKLDVISNTFNDPVGTFTFTHRVAGNFYETGSYTTSPAVAEFVGVMGTTDVTHTPGNRGTNLGGDFYVYNADQNIGVRGTALGPIGTGIGVYGYNTNGTGGVGVFGISDCAAALGSFNTGVEGNASNGTIFNYGVYGFAGPIAGAANVGVYGATIPGVLPGSIAVFGDLGVAAVPPCPAFPCPVVTGPDIAGYFNGDLLSTTAVYTISDASMKENVQAIANPMEIINQLNPKSYTFSSQNPSMQLLSGIRYGLLAQDVQSILPGLVKDGVHPARYDSLGNETHAAINYKAINYTELIPFLIAGMKEQQQQIETLETLVEELSNPSLAQPQGNDESENSSSIDVTLASKSIVLNQNVPNPFKEQTMIEYFIPDDAEQVKIIFTDNKGAVLKEVEIPEKGKGQLNVYAADLSSGIYTYTIIANGVTLDTKKMVKTK